MPRLNVYEIGWYLDVPQCPCDVHFLEYLEAERLTGRVIFHFGTGEHHVVGIKTQESGTGNIVLGITASPKEHDSYERLIIENPEIGRGYKVLFGDIYQLEARLLPAFDIVTLFHVGEFRDQRNDAYGALTDGQMVRRLVGQLKPGGLACFYAGSFAFDIADRIIADLVSEGQLEAAGSFQTLRIYRRR